MLVDKTHDSVGPATGPSVRSNPLPQQPKTGWLGIPEPSRPQVLLRSKGEQYLVLVVTTDQGEFYFPTGEADGDLGTALTQKKSFVVVAAGQYRLHIPAQAVEQHWYRHDQGVHHLAISASTTSEIISVVVDSHKTLRWMKAGELYKMAQERRLSPAMLQVMCIEMMRNTDQ